MFQSFYESFWQHPLLLWAPSVFFLVFVRPRGSKVARAALVFAVLSILDAFFTGPLIKRWALGPAASNAVMIFFVLLGDFRFFYFIERFSEAKDRNVKLSVQRAAIRAAGWTLIVPVIQGALTRLLPGVFDNSGVPNNVRYTFLCYEILFLVLAVFLWWRVIPRRALHADIRRWLSELCVFAMTYYALWSLADLVILAGSDVGYLLRVVPNVLYYGLFVPFVFWRAPPRLKKGSTA